MNYILTNEQVQELIAKKIINPFVPKGENGYTPIYVLNKDDLPLLGEGGLGSGKKLNISEEQRLARRREQLKNAQRKYRDANRTEYNKRQKEIYEAMKDDPTIVKDGKTRYEIWKDNMVVANNTYRAKKRLTRPTKELVKKVVDELKKEWKEKHPVKRGRPTKEDKKKGIVSKREVDKEWLRVEKDKRIAEEMKKLGAEVVIPMVKTDRKSAKGSPIYVKQEIALDKNLIYPYTGDVGAEGTAKGDMPYTAEEYAIYNIEKKKNEEAIAKGEKGKKTLVPRDVRKAYRKLVGKEIVEAEEKKEIKAKAKAEKQAKPAPVKEEPILYDNVRYSDLSTDQKKAYRYIQDYNKTYPKNEIPISRLKVDWFVSAVKDKEV